MTEVHGDGWLVGPVYVGVAQELDQVPDDLRFDLSFVGWCRCENSTYQMPRSIRLCSVAVLVAHSCKYRWWSDAVSTCESFFRIHIFAAKLCCFEHAIGRTCRND